jgi:large subunit ribosomal protein L10
MSKVMKAAIVDYLAGEFEDADSAIVVGAGKLTVEEAQNLRNLFREEDIRFVFVKNRLARVALDRVGMGDLGSVLDGPSAIAVGGEGAIAISKIVMEQKKTMKTLRVLGGIMDGTVIDEDGVKVLSNTPGRKELQAMAMQGFFGPVSDFAKSMDDLLTEVHGLVEAFHDKQAG